MIIELGQEGWKLAETCNKLGTEELLGQLTEECGELVQAAQKVRRALKGTTPVSLDDARVKLIGECADVLLCIDALTLEGLVNPTGMQFVGRYKNDRWYRRAVMGGRLQQHLKKEVTIKWNVPKTRFGKAGLLTM